MVSKMHTGFRQGPIKANRLLGSCSNYYLCQSDLLMQQRVQFLEKTSHGLFRLTQQFPDPFTSLVSPKDIQKNNSTIHYPNGIPTVNAVLRGCRKISFCGSPCSVLMFGFYAREILLTSIFQNLALLLVGELMELPARSLRSLLNMVFLRRIIQKDVEV